MSFYPLQYTYQQLSAFPESIPQAKAPREASIWYSLRTWITLLPLAFFCLNGTSPFDNTLIEMRMAATTSATDSRWTQVLIAAVCLICCALIYRYCAATVAICSEMKAILALPLLATASALWSQEPLHSAVHGFTLLVLTVFAIYLGTRFSMHQQMQLVLVLGFTAILLSIAFAIALPQYGIDLMAEHDNAWKGIFSSKNACGQTVLFLLLPLAFYPARGFARKALLTGYSLLALFVIGMSQAKTAWGLTLFFLLFVVCQRAIGKLRARDASIVLFGAFPLGLVFLSLVYRYSEDILNVLGKEATLSQRTEIWSAILKSIAKQPLLGYGYSAFWNGLHGESFNVFMAVHWLEGQAQNGFLDLWLQVGIVGVIVFLVSLVHAVRNLTVCLRRGLGQHAMWYFAIILISVLYNLDESFLAAPRNLCWLLYLLACVGLHRLATMEGGVELPATA
jgi:exopolysaccharide production protein ExoQ